jgi:SAM-dependent methyltransferase
VGAGGSSAGGAHDPAGAFRDANRRNWDERVALHTASQFYDVDGWLTAGTGPRQREIDALGDVDGLELLHLQCHFGLDTLAWARAGARVTGLDFSTEAIDAARDLTKRAGLAERATFVCADVYSATDVLSPHVYDIVYVSLGALCWLPSVGRWADQVAGLVRPGGRLYLHDIHPLAWALADESLALEHPYFEETAPFVDDSDTTYTDADRTLVNTRSYEWNHGIGEVASALIDRGLRIDTLVEHDWTVHRQFPWLVESEPGHWTVPAGWPRLPLTFTVVATRTD